MTCWTQNLVVNRLVDAQYENETIPDALPFTLYADTLGELSKVACCQGSGSVYRRLSMAGWSRDGLSTCFLAHNEVKASQQVD